MTKTIGAELRVGLEAGNQSLHCEETVFYSLSFVTYKIQEN